MRTLTQVWVFFVSLTFVLLLLGFQLGGRRGLFIAFLLSLLIIYATLHRGLALFKRHLNIKELTGSNSGGFLILLQQTKSQFDMQEVHLHFSKNPTPPLVWKNSPHEGHILIHQDLLNHLSQDEKHIFAG